MLKKLLFIFALLILSINCTRQVNFTKLALTPDLVQHRWSEVEAIVSGEPITSLKIENILFCNQAIKRLLNMDNIAKSLTSLTFYNAIFAQDTMKIIWQSNVGLNLINLTLSLSSMQDSDLKLFPTDKQLNIEYLQLQSGFIGAEGFGYLNQLKMNKLKGLNIYGTSLVTDEAVNNLLKMNFSKITSLNFGFTSISSENALKLLNSLDIQNMSISTYQKIILTPHFTKAFQNLNLIPFYPSTYLYQQLTKPQQIISKNFLSHNQQPQASEETKFSQMDCIHSSTKRITQNQQNQKYRTQYLKIISSNFLLNSFKIISLRKLYWMVMGFSLKFWCIWICLIQIN